PVLGYLDDLVILPALITLSIKLIPSPIMFNARQRAEKERVDLHKNWLFGAIFILIWIIIIYLIISSVLKIFSRQISFIDIIL
ncbi:MAG: hypothetical protein GX435_00770, partial [Exilispira sp.]|nr:hypothetical protein [Exilispira sp.]